MQKNETDIVAANRGQRISETDGFTPFRYAQFATHLPCHATTVLDVGCNTGRGGRVLKEIKPELQLAGLDCVPERISALDKLVYEQGICGLSTDLPIADGTFDAIVAGEFIEHVPPADVSRTLTEFFRVLRLRGRLMLTTPNPDYLKNRLKNLSVLLETSHLSQHYADSLGLRLRMTGFSNVKIFGSGRCSRYLGQRFPILSVYGSYLIRGDKW